MALCATVHMVPRMGIWQEMVQDTAVACTREVLEKLNRRLLSLLSRLKQPSHAAMASGASARPPLRL
jgi:uncharacterized coiled-coil protein SlyX